MIPEIRNHSWNQRIQDLDLISLVQRRLRGQLIEVFKYLDRFSSASARGLFDYDLNDRISNNRAELIVKHFNTSVAHHFYSIKITTTWNALPNEVVSSRTVNSFKNSLDNHWSENPPNVWVNWLQSSMPCTIQVCRNSCRPAFCWKSGNWTNVLCPTITTTTTTSTTSPTTTTTTTTIILVDSIGGARSEWAWRDLNEHEWKYGWVFWGSSSLSSPQPLEL